MIRIEVAYALPQRQRLIALEVEEDCTVLAAVQRSGITNEFPEIDLASARYGIFSTPVNNPAEQILRAGDRVEIYRPLIIDPKAVRKQRAADNPRTRQSKSRSGQ